MRGVIAAAMMLSVTPALAQDTETKVGSWSIKKTVDSFSDAKRGISMTALVPAKGVMVVKCDAPGPDSLYVSFLTSGYLGSDRVSSRYRANLAQFRIDESPAERLDSPSFDGRSAHLFRSNAATLLKRLVAENPKRLRIQFNGYDSLVNVDIDITGAAEAIKLTAAICEDSRFD